MGYSVNRYFKPAVYTPLITEVEYPFKELFAAGKTRQDAEDAARTKTAADNQSAEYLRQVYLAGNKYMDVAGTKALMQAEQDLQQRMDYLSKTIAGGEMSSAEYQSAIGPLQSSINQLYGPNGIFGRATTAKKTYDEGTKIQSSIKDLQLAPWMTYAYQKNLKEFAEGKTDAIDLATLNDAEYVDRQSENNKIIDNIRAEGYAYARPTDDGKYIKSGSFSEISPQKVKEIWEAGFENSKMQRDMMLEYTHKVDILGMDSEQAWQEFLDQKHNLLANAMKVVAQEQAANLKKDPYGDLAVAQNAFLNVDDVNSPSTVNMPLIKNAKAAGVTDKDIWALYQMSLGKNPSNISQAAKDFVLSNDYGGLEGMSNEQKLKTVSQAFQNTSNIHIPQKHVGGNADLSKLLELYMMNEPDAPFRLVGEDIVSSVSPDVLALRKLRDQRIAKGTKTPEKAEADYQEAISRLPSTSSKIKSGNSLAGTDILQVLGYKSQAEFLKEATVTGMNKIDYGSGYGSIMLTVTNKHDGKRVQLEMGTPKQFSQLFTGVGTLADASYKGSKDQYVAFGINDKGEIDYSKSRTYKSLEEAKRATDANGNAWPIVMQSETNIVDKTGKPRFDTKVKTYVFSGDNYKVMTKSDGSIDYSSTDEVYEAAYKQWVPYAVSTYATQLERNKVAEYEE